MGVGPGDVAHVTLSYHIMPGGLRLHRAFEEAGCAVINGGTGQSRLQVEVAQAWSATVYAGTPSFLANLGDTAREMGLDPRSDLTYRVGFSTAEAADAEAPPRPAAPCSASSSSITAARRRSARWPASAASTRACTSTRATSSASSSIPTPASPSAPGGTGELVATQLGPRALPLVRYAPGDVFRLLDGAVPVRRSRRCASCSSGRRAPSARSRASSSIRRRCTRRSRELPEVGRFQIVVDHPEGQRYERARLRVGLTDAAGGPRRRSARRRRTREGDGADRRWTSSSCR